MAPKWGTVLAKGVLAGSGGSSGFSQSQQKDENRTAATLWTTPKQILHWVWNYLTTEWAKSFIIEDLDNTRNCLRALQIAQGDLEAVSMTLSGLYSSGKVHEYPMDELISVQIESANKTFHMYLEMSEWTINEWNRKKVNSQLLPDKLYLIIFEHSIAIYSTQ